jgi:hypothetical protein
MTRKQAGGSIWRAGMMMGMSDALHAKVLAIFAEMVGERAKRLDGCIIAEPAMSIIGDAFATEYDQETAHSIGFHMADWNSDAAFMVAVHLFPDKFTADEIRDGVELFLCHAPNHIREACRITGQYVWESFPELDSTGPPD